MNHLEILEYAKKRDWIVVGNSNLSLKSISKEINHELKRKDGHSIRRLISNLDKVSLSPWGKAAFKAIKGINSYAMPPQREERDLHKVFSVFAKGKFGCDVITIHHERSKKERGQNQKWSHPDIVGAVQRTINAELKSKKELYTIYSFELKTNLKFNNVTQSFAQAFLNSSWAHEGYLVSPNIDKEESFFHELQLLHSIFGIGIIELIRTNPAKSKILVPSKRRSKLNHTLIERLASKNQEFANFIGEFVL
ncbi:hypothetical protein EHO58_10115 [Leptospira selangorensis]|uniref:hypothetical protein n=1 Tax=Leptospira selangorensis TaxID=2484982 RepID=UPI001082C7B2|nr:hypothetical protein [Leptospira selangorensis]TGK06098.1 hypothetical protein EHO58_10115 [Leptospira selangorensis]